MNIHNNNSWNKKTIFPHFYSTHIVLKKKKKREKRYKYHKQIELALIMILYNIKINCFRLQMYGMVLTSHKNHVFIAE